MADLTIHTEKDLENWIAANIADVMDDHDAFVVGQQIRLPNGQILDVLAGVWETWAAGPEDDTSENGILRLTIIEVKRDRIDSAAVAQLLTYMGALDVAADRARRQRLDGEGRKAFSVHGLLAAPAITQEAALAIRPLQDVGFVLLETNIVASQPDNFAYSSCDSDNCDALAKTLKIEHFAAWDSFHRSVEASIAAREVTLTIEPPDEGQVNAEQLQPA